MDDDDIEEDKEIGTSVRCNSHYTTTPEQTRKHHITTRCLGRCRLRSVCHMRVCLITCEEGVRTYVRVKRVFRYTIYYVALCSPKTPANQNPMNCV